MSEFHVSVVSIGNIQKHPNADLLSMTNIGGDGGYPVLFKTGDFHEGDRAVYVPVGAAVPVDDPRWSFLVKPGMTKTHIEIEAKRLRGIFSMGILTQADAAWDVGRDVAEELRIVRHEPVDASGAGADQNEADPGLLPVYTDIEGLRGWPHILQEGEEVIVTLKIHGENARYAVNHERLYCGSRTRWKRPDARTPWTVAGEHLKLEERLQKLSGTIGIFGELYGNVAGMRYDATSAARGLRLFDAMDVNTRQYLDYDDFVAVAAALNLPTAPVLYRGRGRTICASWRTAPTRSTPRTSVRGSWCGRCASGSIRSSAA